MDERLPNRIVCAAIRNSRGEIICGVRHYDPIMRGQIRDRGKWKSDVEQGFVDRYGNFLRRREAWPIAEAAGQIVGITPNQGILYSEDIY